MKYVFLAIQYTCVLTLFSETIYLVKHWKSMLYSYLILNCLVGFLNTLGYLAALYASTLESYVTAIQLSYGGRVWYTFTLLLFTAELCKKKFPAILKAILILFSTATFVMVITVMMHNLYYKISGFSMEGYFPRLLWERGPWYNLFMLVQIVYMTIIFFWLFDEFKKVKNQTEKKKFIMVIASMITQSLFFILEMIGLKGVKGYYDLTMIGCLLGTIFIYIAILRFDLMETRQLAEKFMIDKLAEGIIATDSDGEVQYFNQPAKNLFPELKIGDKKIPDKVLKMLEDGKKMKNEMSDEHVSIADRIFLAEENDLIRNDKCFGKIYTLIDETEHIRYMKEKENLRVKQLEIENYKKQIRMGNETIFSIANAVEARDKLTGRHSLRVSEYAVLIAEELGFSTDQMEQLRKTGLLHDIGKIGVPDSILNKPAELTDDEYEIMKTHTTIGSEILKDFTFIPHVDEGAKFHHERYDGTGYPTGLKGEEIPLNARIIGIADAFDAMTANRIYRKAMNIEDVKKEIKNCAGTQFDPKLAEILLKLIESGKIHTASMSSAL